MLALDLAFRGGATVLLLLLAALLLRDGRGVAANLGAAFAAGAAAYAQSSAAAAADWPLAVRAPLLALSTGNVVVFWLFARALFDDTFSLRPWHLALWLALAAASLVNCTVLVPAQVATSVTPALAVTSLSFVALALWQAVTSWSADLVERRRRLRLLVTVTAAGYGALATLLQLSLGSEAPTQAVSTLSGMLLTAVVIVIAGAMTSLDAGDLLAAVRTEPATAPEAPNAEDRRLIAALERLMAQERVYRQEGLTIGALAGRLGIPEYRLRRLINQTLGHRNFNTFLNALRIAEAKAALADPAQAEVPVTTIALDAGFQSLGPFNRAFKAVTGLTPSEYRRTNLATART
jgi:AraC-like DNA-binding protein